MWPNQEQIKSLMRDILQIAGTILVMLHIAGITQTQWDTISGSILMLIPTIWGLFSHKKTNAVAVVAAMKGTTFEPHNSVIRLHEPDLIVAAKEAATER